MNLRDEILRRFVKVEAAIDETYWQVAGEPSRGGRRVHEIGKAVANVHFVHASGYEVVLQFPDGKLDSFNPFNLFPVAKPNIFLNMKKWNPSQQVTCIFCQKFKGTPRSLRQHWCPALPPPKGNKKHSAPLTREQWQACLDAANPSTKSKARVQTSEPWAAL